MGQDWVLSCPRQELLAQPPPTCYILPVCSFIQQRLPIWVRHQFSNKLFDQDGVFLAMQEQRLRRGGVKGASGGGGPNDWAKVRGCDRSMRNGEQQ